MRHDTVRDGGDGSGWPTPTPTCTPTAPPTSAPPTSPPSPTSPPATTTPAPTSPPAQTTTTTTQPPPITELPTTGAEDTALLWGSVLLVLGVPLLWWGRRRRDRPAAETAS